MRTPRVSIGLPVHNGGERLQRALDSLLAQEFRDFELIVSDNASTDDTARRLDEAAARDPRLRVVHQPHNLGAFPNFEFVLRQARGEYFMFAAADDAWAPDFVRRNAEFLDAHPDYVASTSRVAFDDGTPVAEPDMGTFALADDARRNVERFVLRPGANSRYYGLHRRAALLAAWDSQVFWACDWVTTCRVIAQGKYHELPDVAMWRGNAGASRNAWRSLRQWGLGWPHTVFPMWPFTRFVLASGLCPRTPRVFWRLLLVNLAYSRKMLAARLRERFSPPARGGRD